IGRDLPRITRDGRDYFLLSNKGEMYLVENLCPHRGGPLKFGHVDSMCRIVCPMHHNAYSADRLIAQPTTLRLIEQAVS
ncbi:MAG: Rieske (2Fe-2S) protein, partial [Acetobacteraceae bacterium]